LKGVMYRRLWNRKIFGTTSEVMVLLVVVVWPLHGAT